MTKNIILCVDDEVTILKSLKAELKTIFSGEYMIEVAQTGPDALELVDELIASDYQVPLVISDYLMPEMKGDELLKHIHDKLPHTIKIMLTGHAAFEGVAYAIQHAKLYRYMTKPWQHDDFKLTVTEAVGRYLQDQDLKDKNASLEILNRQQAELIYKLQRKEIHLQQLNQSLKNALLTEIKLRELTREQEESNRKLTTLSATDGLTGIANRRHFDEFLASEWRKAFCTGLPLALSILDVDLFKNFNDQYGHLAGDDCLRSVARFLKEKVRRECDLVARYGGEEFAFICPATDAEIALIKAHTVCEGLEKLSIRHDQSPFKKVTASIGVAAHIPRDGEKPEVLLKKADQALYRAKALGRNRAETC